MYEETKTYVFGNSDQTSPLLAAMNNGGFGGNNAWWVIVLLAALWGGNGFGRNNNDCSQLYSTLTNGQNSNLIMDAINGNNSAISQLAQTIGVSTSELQSAICNINQSICQVSNQVGMSGAQIINAIQSGNTNLQQQLAQCCCDNKLLSVQQGYENRLAINDQTTLLSSKIDYQTNVISDKFCDLEKRELQSKISALQEINSTLKGQIDNANQTAAITAYINQVVSPVAADVAALKAATPPTVAVPYPQLSAVPTQSLCGFYNGFYNGFGPCNGSIWS